MLAHVRREHVVGRVRDVVPQRLDEGLIGQVHVLVAGAEQHDRALGVRRQRRLGGEPRLADPRLAGDQHQLALAVLRLRPRRRQCLGLRIAAEHCERRLGHTGRQRHARRQRFPLHCKGSDGLGQSLERQLAERCERVTATAGQAADDIGDHDLSAGRDGAEPRGLDHGRTIDVAVLARRFARGDADADLHRIAAGAAPRSIGRLLHGDGAGNGARGAVEAQHQAVAGGLHLAAIVFRHGAAQRGEVRVAQRLVGIVPEAARQLGGADEIGEDDGDGLGARHVSDPDPPSLNHLRQRLRWS